MGKFMNGEQTPLLQSVWSAIHQFERRIEKTFLFPIHQLVQYRYRKARYRVKSKDGNIFLRVEGGESLSQFRLSGRIIDAYARYGRI
jgi:hypothetical protein